MQASTSNATYSGASTSIESQLQRLMPLVGTWEGRGKGSFPTITSFDYQETLIVRHRPETPYLIYEQSAFLINESGVVGKASHWESGVIRPRDDGSIIVSSAHDSARVEVLQGNIDESANFSGMLSIKLQSILHGNDPRMAASAREWFINGNELRYIMKMATQTTAELTHHLEALLARVG